MLNTTALSDTFEFQLKAAGIDGWERECRFVQGRQYRADFFWSLQRLIVEIDGGQYTGGAHNSAMGKERDCIRDAEAQIAGFAVIRLCTSLVTDGRGLELVERFLARFGECQPAAKKRRA